MVGWVWHQPGSPVPFRAGWVPPVSDHFSIHFALAQLSLGIWTADRAPPSSALEQMFELKAGIAP